MMAGDLSDIQVRPLFMANALEDLSFISRSPTYSCCERQDLNEIRMKHRSGRRIKVKKRFPVTCGFNKLAGTRCCT